MTTPNLTRRRLRAGMVGLGMIFDETYRPFFEQLHAEGLYRRDFGLVDVELAAVASRTGSRAERYRQQAARPRRRLRQLLRRRRRRRSCSRTASMSSASPRRTIATSTPARPALEAGKHVLIEKPSVLSLQELDELDALARKQGVLAKVVYHKLVDPDHKKLRTHVVDGVLQHVNNGYCSLLEPKSISGSQFAEWITGRNPGTYVAVHYIKLIDFTFGPDWQLARITCHRPARPRRPGRRPDLGLGAAADGLHATPTAARRRSTSTPAGSRPTTSPATSSRKCSSASTTASGTPTSASAASSDRRRPHAAANSRSR